MKNILFVHQSSELYGSDKTLLHLVIGFQKKGYNPIVVLPQKGPLEELLIKANITVFISPVLKISRKMFSFKSLLSLPKQKVKAFKILDAIDKEAPIDLVYSNTLAVFIGILYAKHKKIKHLWHVHEIIESPKPVVSFFKKILQWKSNSVIVYNSKATKEFWNKDNAVLNAKTQIILNGLEKPKISLSLEEKNTLKKELFLAQNNELIIGLVGRISRWKGQALLLEAFEQLAGDFQNAKLVFVGSTPPGQAFFLENLIQKVDAFQLHQRVTIVPFQQDITKIWEIIDIAVVPSTEPEPFGLVAVEAMLASKPVIGANHGGLKEIIRHKETGLLVAPGNVVELKKALEILIQDKELRESMGKKAYERAISEFSLETYVNKIDILCQSTMHKGV